MTLCADPQATLKRQCVGGQACRLRPRVRGVAAPELQGPAALWQEQRAGAAGRGAQRPPHPPLPEGPRPPATSSPSFRGFISHTSRPTLSCHEPRWHRLRPTETRPSGGRNGGQQAGGTPSLGVTDPDTSASQEAHGAEAVAPARQGKEVPTSARGT